MRAHCILGGLVLTCIVLPRPISSPRSIRPSRYVVRCVPLWACAYLLQICAVGSWQYIKYTFANECSHMLCISGERLHVSILSERPTICGRCRFPQH